MGGTLHQELAPRHRDCASSDAPKEFPAAGVSLGSLFLPVAAVAAAWLPAIARHTRIAVMAALGAPHMLAARARGVSPRRLLLVHAVRDAVNPQATVTNEP